jgi:hypothetical protein
MTCYRDGGCSPYEMRSCGECPHSGPPREEKPTEITFSMTALNLSSELKKIGQSLTTREAKAIICEAHSAVDPYSALGREIGKLYSLLDELAVYRKIAPEIDRAWEIEKNRPATYMREEQS